MLGIVRLARGRPDGMQQFGASRDSFPASLAPLIAFPLVGGLLMLLGGGGLSAVSDLLATLCALVAPLVLSFEAARLWRRQQFWLRFATAFNWCQWVIPVVGSVLLLVFGVMTALGLPRQTARIGVVFGLLSYALWLHWFLARYGLVFLGVAMVAGTGGTLIGGRVQQWLLVLVYICLAASFAGIYLKSR